MIFSRLFPSTDSVSERKRILDPLKITLIFQKYRTVFFLGFFILLALFFFFSGGGTDEKSADKNIDFYEYSEALRSELESTLSRVSGVGKCTVFLTFSDGGETVYAYDEDYRESEGGTLSGNRTYVLISSRADGLILKVCVPSVAGVAVICEGGDSARVKSDVTEILSGTLGISASRISVKKRSIQE